VQELQVSIDERWLTASELEDVTLRLRRDLLELPVTDVQHVSAGPAPAGSRSIDPSTVGELVVLLQSSATLIVSVVAAIRAWRRHTIPDSTIRLKLGDDEIELTNVSEETEAALLADWTSRHGG
jgi:hypothetical protein